MIIVGKKPKRLGRFKRLKGQIINGYLIVEDIYYTDHASGRRHKCLCKCIACGSIRRMDIKKLQNNEKPCSCGLLFHSNIKFRQIRGKMLKTLCGEINRLSMEALFKEDYERLENLKEVAKFIRSKTLDNYFLNTESIKRERKLWKS